MEFKLKIDDKILTGVLDEAGSRYWCHDLEWIDFKCEDSVVTCWEALLAGKLDYVCVVETGDGDVNRKHLVTRQKIADAIQIIATKYPHHLGNVLGGYEHAQADMWTGDVLLQCAALGDIVYV